MQQLCSDVQRDASVDGCGWSDAQLGFDIYKTT